MKSENPISRFKNRQDAGRQLAARLAVYKKKQAILVLGLPRGGAVVAWEVAKALDAPLDLFLVRKLGVPGQPELAMGALAEGGLTLMNQNIISELNISEEAIRKAIDAESQELLRRQKLYRGHHAAPVVKGKEIILVDDGLATGATMQAAVKALKKIGAEKIIVAVPVGEAGVCKLLRKQVDDFVCLLVPGGLRAVGEWYENFDQTSDDEVLNLLNQSRNKFIRGEDLKTRA